MSSCTYFNIPLDLQQTALACFWLLVLFHVLLFSNFIFFNLVRSFNIFHKSLTYFFILDFNHVLELSIWLIALCMFLHSELYMFKSLLKKTHVFTTCGTTMCIVTQ